MVERVTKSQETGINIDIAKSNISILFLALPGLTCGHMGIVEIAFQKGTVEGLFFIIMKPMAPRLTSL